MLLRLTSIALMGTLLSAATASTAWSHGTERDFGTAIDGRGASARQRVSGGSPIFTLMLIETNSRAMLRAIDEDQPSEIRERALRLPGLIEDLRRRSRGLELPEQQRSDEATTTLAAIAAIAESTLRIGTAAEESDTPALQHEIAELKRLVASMKGFLRETAQR